MRMLCECCMGMRQAPPIQNQQCFLHLKSKEKSGSIETRHTKMVATALQPAPGPSTRPPPIIKPLDMFLYLGTHYSVYLVTLNVNHWLFYM